MTEMDDCVFCKIVKGEIPSEKEAETRNLLVVRDVNPKAPIHLLIMPKKHIRDITEDSGVIWASIGKLAVKLAKRMKLSGFRLTHNAQDAAAIAHMHVHFFGNITQDRNI